LTIHAASGKPYGRPDVKLFITAPDSGVRVKSLVIPASGFIPAPAWPASQGLPAYISSRLSITPPFSILAVS
jgi:hypothetical protein